MMKKIHILFIFLLSFGFAANAQVKIGSNPTAITANKNLEVEATDGKKVSVNKSNGITYIENMPTAMATDSVVMRSVNGEIRQMSLARFLGQMDTDGDGIVNSLDPDIDGDGVLNAADDCPMQYGCEANGCPSCPPLISASTNGTGIVTAYGGAACTGNATITGTMTEGVAVSGVNLELYANVTTLGSYNLSALQNGVTFTATGTFLNLGCQLITLSGAGAPTTTGATTWTTNTTPSGMAMATVASPAPTGGNTAGTTVVNPVVATCGKTWMDRNLGASRAATSATDHESYGSIYQWGRPSDGHELMNWTNGTTGTPVNTTITATQSTTNAPGHSDYIAAYANNNWLDPQNDNLWVGVSGINNPCPTGYRLPTLAEFNCEEALFSPQTNVGAYNSALKLPSAGERLYSTGAVNGVGGSVNVWTSSTSSIYANYYAGNSGVSITSGRRQSYGHSVRCIKD